MPFGLLSHPVLHRGSHRLLRALATHSERGVLRLDISRRMLHLLDVLRHGWLVVPRTRVSDGLLVELDTITSRCPQA